MRPNCQYAAAPNKTTAPNVANVGTARGRKRRGAVIVWLSNAETGGGGTVVLHYAFHVLL